MQTEWKASKTQPTHTQIFLASSGNFGSPRLSTRDLGSLLVLALALGLDFSFQPGQFGIKHVSKSLPASGLGSRHRQYHFDFLFADFNFAGHELHQRKNRTRPLRSRKNRSGGKRGSRKRGSGMIHSVGILRSKVHLRAMGPMN